MVLMTMIARLADALPLSASVHDDTHVQAGRSMVEYQNQAKQLFKKMNSNSPVRGSVETGAYLFQFVFFSNNYSFFSKISNLNFKY